MSWIRSIFGYDVLFVCSASVDEAWVRTTLAACARSGLKVCLATCDGDSGSGLAARYAEIGAPTAIGVSFAGAARIRARVVVTASSGLNRGIFPTRAKHFVHMPHSLVSLHMAYPEGAFDGYDWLFAAGPHHCAEFEAISRVRGLANHGALPIGYGKLDILAAEPAPPPERRVLLAPSWGPDNLLDRCGEELASALLDAGWQVTVRPHPLFMIEGSAAVDRLALLARQRSGLTLESSLGEGSAMRTAAVLIGDYSGAGFEFVALHGRPVVSVDVGGKVANPDWESIGMEPVERGLRPELGEVVAPDVSAIVAAVERLAGTGRNMDAAQKRFLFGTPGSCAAQASEAIMKLVKA